MRILIATINRALEGGAETYQRALIPALAAAGHPVAMVYERPVPAGLPTVDQDAAGIPAWAAADVGLDDALARAAEWSPDVVYVQGLGSPALESALLDRWPAVLFAHGYYGTCESGTKRHAFPRIAMCTRRFGPACLALHHVRRCGGLSPLSMFSMYRLQGARRALLLRYRAVCVASQHMRSEYLRHALAPDLVHVLPLPPSGITRDPVPPALRPSPRHVVLAGRLTDLKGGALLLDALSQAGAVLARPLSLTVLGDGPERHRMEARARQRGLDARFLGWATPSERNRVFRSADLLAIPSVWPEPWGLVGLEAACAGVPAVAFAVGGIPEWLVAGESGEVAPGDAPTAGRLSEAIVRALRDPTHHARLCRGAWEHVAGFTMERHLGELVPVLTAAAG